MGTLIGYAKRLEVAIEKELIFSAGCPKHLVAGCETQYVTEKDGEKMSKRKQVRLLVVDEQTEFCELIQEIAELASHKLDIRCEFTDCATEASKLAVEWSPSVILVDADLSSINSQELVRSFKDVQAPVVVTSQVQSRTIEESARHWGASGYVAKSEHHADVERLVMELAKLATAERCIH